MKKIFLTTLTIFILVFSAFGQIQIKSVSANKIFEQIEKGKNAVYENIQVTNDLDLSKLSKRTNDATYPEKGKTARVYTAKIKKPVIFRNVVFTGKLDFFRRDESALEIKEYRVAFDKEVVFENCTFRENVDFELTNFDGGVSFEKSVFKTQPLFIRVGLQKAANFTKTVFKNGLIFKNFQDDAEQNLTAENLDNFYREYLKGN